MRLLHHPNLFLPLLLATLLFPPIANATEPFAVPGSDRQLEFEISLPNGKHAKVWAREGSMITVQGSSAGTSVNHGFVPMKDKQNVRLLPLSISDDMKSVEQCGEPILVDSPEHEICGLRRLSIAFKGYTTERFPSEALTDPLEKLSPTDLDRVYGKAAGGTCCVTCDGYTVCASRVKLGCGSCDSGSGGGGGAPSI